MHVPITIALCFAAAAILLVLDRILRAREDRAESTGVPRAKAGRGRGSRGRTSRIPTAAERPAPASGAIERPFGVLAARAESLFAGAGDSSLAAAGEPAGSSAYPVPASAAPSSGEDWVAQLDASWPEGGSPRRFAEVFLREAAQREPIAGAGLWLEAADPAAGPLFEAECGLLESRRAAESSLAALFRPWRDALRAGETVCIPDSASEPDLAGRIRLAAANLLLVPFQRGEAGLAVLAVAWNRPAAAGEPELALARRLAARAGAALAHRGGRPAGTRLPPDQVLVRVAAALRHAGDLDAVLHAMLEAVCDGLGYRNGAVLLVDPATGQLYVASQVGYPEPVGHLRLDLDGPSVSATAAREQRIVTVPDVREWRGYVEGDPDVRSEIALPLVANGEILGILDVESVEEGAFAGAQTVLEAAADEAALVLAHARLLHDLRQRADQLQAADRLARAITGSIDPSVILDSVVHEVRRAVDADAALILRLGDGDLIWTPAAASWRGPAAPPRPLVADSEAAHEVSSGSGGYFDDTALGGTAFSHWCHAAGWRSVYWISVQLDGLTVGLFLALSRGETGLGPDRLATLEALAPHVRAAIRNAQLYERLESSYESLSEARAENVRSEQLRVLGEMTSGLAHKFNNMLGVVLGRVQTGLARTDDQALRRDLRIVEKAAHEGAVAIRQLQQFTGTRGERAARPVNLAEVARRVVERAERGWRPGEASEHPTHRSAIELPDEAWVLGIPEEIEEVVQHVVDNAVEAMPQGGYLGVRAERREEAWSLEVRDTGPGIGEETRNRLFHPFVTTKGPRKLGLGLSIAYAIVTRHNGWIEVDSDAERGTALRVTLPASEAPAETTSTEQILPARPARILVVDDEPAVAEVLAEMLASAGYEAVVASSSTEAVERLTIEPFDAVLTDLGMPGLTGWDLALHCRHQHSETPVILVTGWGLEVDDQRIAETGVFGVVAKPFEMRAVLDVVSRAISRPGQRAA